MPRIYTVMTENVTVSAAQDLMQVKGGSGVVTRIRRWEISCSDQSPASSQMLRFMMQFLPATVTDGTGGTTPTPTAEPGNPAATFTVKANNQSTQASSNGTVKTHWQGAAHLLTPLDYTPMNPFPIMNSESGVLSCIAAPSGTVHLTTCLTIEEMGG